MSSRKAFDIMRSLTRDDFTHMYSHSWGLAHNCVGCC